MKWAGLRAPNAPYNVIFLRYIFSVTIDHDTYILHGAYKEFPTRLTPPPHPFQSLIRPCIILTEPIISQQNLFVVRCPVFNTVADKLDTSECPKSKCPPYNYRSNEVDVGRSCFFCLDFN